MIATFGRVRAPLRVAEIAFGIRVRWRSRNLCPAGGVDSPFYILHLPARSASLRGRAGRFCGFKFYISSLFPVPCSLYFILLIGFFLIIPPFVSFTEAMMINACGSILSTSVFSFDISRRVMTV